mmetsp:Transcript_15105/g.16796  ORF Transcript_15105/g.16796 Transcript_15105/m.16796 type:complete len:196 (+) Transcript_15105:70-657(+)|eukprot:CAMPEP_0114996076 /NCGR_PEP_ID=MMETSP0216-20121206/14099_1 /TAXON_ID=223996 /ORGANISM="Protocruzia adherens, Strain Boccale" /LENGTH=195 /DNA_ID=CAMNT_0002360219 /DNA_START=31 /DNA_END=618 /DNA_ORIENTATION=+
MEANVSATAFQSKLQHLRASNRDTAKVFHCANIISKLVKNIVDHPDEDKYRVVKKSNKAIQNKILSVKGAEDLLLSIGFIHIDEEQLGWFVEDNMNLLRDTVLPQLAQLMTEITPEESAEEKERARLLKERQAAIDEKFRKDQEYKKALQKQMELDRKDKQGDVVRSSHARQAGFGAQQATWKDIGVDLSKQARG